jgi:hypothetical protein
MIAVRRNLADHDATPGDDQPLWQTPHADGLSLDFCASLDRSKNKIGQKF